MGRLSYAGKVPWTPVNRIPLEGTITARTATSVQLDGKWYRVSKFAAIPVTIPAVGTRVRLWCDRQGWVRSVEVLG